jgi:hypothetical protein
MSSSSIPAEVVAPATASGWPFTLPWLGFVPDDVALAPPAAVARLAERLQVPMDGLRLYGEREQTRTDHLRSVASYLGWRLAGPLELRELDEFLLARAMEHDAPTLLFRLACEHLISARVIRPGVVRVMERIALRALDFSGGNNAQPLIAALGILRQLNETGARKVPDGAPTEFVPARWMGYLEQAARTGNTVAYRHYWELTVLLALRDGLRSGDVFVPGSRRYANPATYLLTSQAWDGLRPEFCQLVGKSAEAVAALRQSDAELHTA